MEKKNKASQIFSEIAFQNNIFPKNFPVILLIQHPLRPDESITKNKKSIDKTSITKNVLFTLCLKLRHEYQQSLLGYFPPLLYPFKNNL